MTGVPQDMRRLMAEAQRMQVELQKAQDELATKTYEATAGGGAVIAVVRGSGDVGSVTFDPEVLDPEDPEMAGDLVVAAVNLAHAAAAAAAAAAMGGMTAGMDLGGLLG